MNQKIEADIYTLSCKVGRQWETSVEHNELCNELGRWNGVGVRGEVQENIGSERVSNSPQYTQPASSRNSRLWNRQSQQENACFSLMGIEALNRGVDLMADMAMPEFKPLHGFKPQLKGISNLIFSDSNSKADTF